MSPEEWQRVKQIFQDALECPPATRAAFLEEACGADLAIRGEVQSLLDYHEPAQGFIEESAMAATAAGTGIEVGQRIGRYKIVCEINRGGMGVVYLAERDDVGGQVAIKVLPNAFLSPARRERFASEQRTLAALNHPFIAQLYDLNVLNDGTPWFAMEYVDGVTITDYCEGRPIEECLQLFRSVCEAVKYAHGRMVIHRDLKPSNILVRSDGQNATPKLLDFGIAKQLDVSDGTGDFTLPALRLLTPNYAAPELFQSSGLFPADVYSLGVILYELLTGQLPIAISNQTPAEIERIKMETDMERPSTVAKRNVKAGSLQRMPSAGSWADLDVLCLTAMHGDLGQRYESVEALLGDIDSYLNSKPLKARPVTLTYKLGKFTKRHRLGVATAAIVFTVVVSLVTFFTIRLTRARNEALAAAARTQRIQRFMSSLFAGGDKRGGPSADLRVVTLIDRGVQEAQALDREPEVQAELFHTLGTTYQNLGRFDLSETLLRDALNRRRELLGPDHPAVAESLVALGLLRVDQSKLDEAEVLIREGLEKSRRLSPPDKNATLSAVTALGKVLNARGKYDEATKVLEEVLESGSASEALTPELTATMNQLANAHYYAGHYDISESLNKRVLAFNRQLFTEHHILVADDLLNLGSIEFQRGHYPEAEQLYRQALTVTQGWYSKDHPELASNLTLLAQSLTFQERYDEAQKLLQQALEINERAYSPPHQRIALALHELGNLALRRSQFKEAETLLLRAAEINRAVYKDDHPRTITTMSSLGSVYFERKEYARAEKILREVVERYARISPDHLNTGIARIKLGQTLLAQHRYHEAKGQTLPGYEIVMKQTSPTARWHREALKDLVKINHALNDPVEAAKFTAILEKK